MQNINDNTDVKNLEKILKIYFKDKSITHPFSGKKLSKSKRIKNLYDIIQNNVHGVEFTNQEKIIASKLITDILEETDS
jgi:hypothetical protein